MTAFAVLLLGAAVASGDVDVDEPFEPLHVQDDLIWQPNNGTVEDYNLARSGTGSFLLPAGTTGANGGWAWGSFNNVDDQSAPKNLHIRWWGNHSGQTYLVHGTGVNNQYGQITYNRHWVIERLPDGSVRLMLHTGNGTLAEMKRTNIPGTIPSNTWAEYVVNTRVGDSGGSVVLYVNGTEVLKYDGDTRGGATSGIPLSDNYRGVAFGAAAQTTAQRIDDLRILTYDDGSGTVAPMALGATSEENVGIRLMWQDFSMVETGFEIQRALQPTFLNAQVTYTPANTTEFIDSVGVTGTSYVYRVRALGANGTVGQWSTITTAVFPSMPGGGGPDTDGDGWSDDEETSAGTDPNDPDSYPVTPPGDQEPEGGQELAADARTRFTQKLEALGVEWADYQPENGQLPTWTIPLGELPGHGEVTAVIPFIVSEEYGGNVVASQVFTKVRIIIRTFLSFCVFYCFFSSVWTVLRQY